MHAAQTAAVPVKHVSKADIVVDGRAGIIISRRDKCLLALILCCGRDEAYAARNGIQTFADVREHAPDAFAEVKNGRHPLDEIHVPL